jgi:hypothetical protein
MFGVDIKYFAASNILIIAPMAVFFIFKTYPTDQMDYTFQVPVLKVRCPLPHARALHSTAREL